jgi:hypothetical protein
MSYSKSSVFRKVALDRLSSPEQLDLLMQVTSRRSWLALAALTLLMATAVYWILFGQIPFQQAAPAVLMTSGGVKQVAALESGQLYAWHVEVGDLVKADQVIAEILPPGRNTTIPIRTVHEGRILDLNSDIGDLIQSGDSLARLHLVAPDVHLEAIFYLPPGEAGRIQVGMPVQIVPLTAGGHEVWKGFVTNVGDYPVSQQQVIRLLGSDTGLQKLLPAGPPIEVRVQVETTGAVAQLPPGLVGSQATATVQLGVQRPIELIIP